MEGVLEQQLQSALADERRAAAERLGELGTEAAVNALIALAESASSLEDQLMAIECLGDTQSTEARTYVQALCCETVREVPTTYRWGTGPDMHDVTCFDEEHVFPNAPGPLGFALMYSVQLDEVAPNGEWLRKRSDEAIAADRESIPRSRDAFRVVRDALARLT